MFVQGSVTSDKEEATFIAVAEDGHTVGELFVDETVGEQESTDAFSSVPRNSHPPWQTDAVPLHAPNQVIDRWDLDQLEVGHC